MYFMVSSVLLIVTRLSPRTGRAAAPTRPASPPPAVAPAARSISGETLRRRASAASVANLRGAAMVLFGPKLLHFCLGTGNSTGCSRRSRVANGAVRPNALQRFRHPTALLFLEYCGRSTVKPPGSPPRAPCRPPVKSDGVVVRQMLPLGHLAAFGGKKTCQVGGRRATSRRRVK